MRLTVFIFLIFSSALAQEKAEEKLGVTVKLGGLTPALQVEANAPETTATKLTYKPSTQAKTFLAADNEHFGISLSAYNPRTSEFRQTYGNGQSLDFQFRLTWQAYYLETYLQQYKGYYLSNPEEVMTAPFGPNGEYPKNSSLRGQHYGVQAFRFSNPESFHPRRAFQLVDRSRQSGGSWYSFAATHYHEAKTTQSLVPATAIDNYSTLSDWKKATAWTVAAGGGGAYSYVYNEHWVLSGLLGFGLGQQWSSAKYLNDKENKAQLVLKSQVKLAAGYSGESFLSGFNVQFDSTQIRLKSTEIVLSAVETSVFVGWRF